MSYSAALGRTGNQAAEFFGNQADAYADEDGFRAPRVKTTHG